MDLESAYDRRRKNTTPTSYTRLSRAIRGCRSTIDIPQIMDMPDVKAAKTLEEQDALILSRFRQSRDRVAMQERSKRLQKMLSKPGGI